MLIRRVEIMRTSASAASTATHTSAASRSAAASVAAAAPADPGEAAPPPSLGPGPEDGADGTDSAGPAVLPGEVPDFRGMSVGRAIDAARAALRGPAFEVRVDASLARGRTLFHVATEAPDVNVSALWPSGLELSWRGAAGRASVLRANPQDLWRVIEPPPGRVRMHLVVGGASTVWSDAERARAVRHGATFTAGALSTRGEGPYAVVDADGMGRRR